MPDRPNPFEGLKAVAAYKTLFQYQQSSTALLPKM
jgi:hypothetical protein